MNLINHLCKCNICHKPFEAEDLDANGVCLDCQRNREARIEEELAELEWSRYVQELEDMKYREGYYEQRYQDFISPYEPFESDWET